MIWIIIIIAIIIVIVFISRQNARDETSKKEVKFDNSTDSKTNYSEKKDSTTWELVRRKSERWNELGFGDGDNFPGYGKLYDREFQVWYCDVGSKEKKETRIFHDRNPLNYEPKNIGKITGEGVYLERLNNTKEYETLYSGLDNKNRKRWYFALIKYTSTGIETEKALETKEEIVDVEEELNIPEGWKLVKRKSDEWFKNGFGDNESFPGYGKIFERTFDVWYCEIGSKEKIPQPEFKDKAILKFYNGICGDLGELKGKGLKFESLSKTQNYIELLTTVDNKDRKRWYFGLKKTEPTYIFTAPA